MEIVTLSELSEEQLQKLVGKRVVFGGRGILDGLKHISRASSDRVIKIIDDQDYGKCLRVKEYCRKKTVLLPHCNWNQQVAILTEKEYKELPQW